MEEEIQGCHEDDDSVMAQLSLMEISDALHHHHHLQMKKNRDFISPVSMEVSDVYRPSVLACAPPASSMEVCFAPHDQQKAVDEEHKQGFDDPCWAEMLPDALVKIFSHLSLQDMLCTIPFVCRTWRCISQDAPCWQNVDLSEWSRDKQPKTIERMLLLVANRSQGGLQEIYAPNVKNDRMLRVIACSGSQLQVLRIPNSFEYPTVLCHNLRCVTTSGASNTQLQVLRIPNSFVSEECICELAPKLASLTYLDISGHFPSKALVESFGKHCHFITRLDLNMSRNVSNTKSCDGAALAVAQYMPQLKHLEMACGLLSNIGFKALLENCRSLEHLDLRGCWHVSMEECLTLEASKRMKVFYFPVAENDVYDMSDDDDYDDPMYYDECFFDYYDEYDFENMYQNGFEDFNGQEVSMLDV